MANWNRLTDYVRRNGIGYTLRRALQMADDRLLRRYDRAFRRKAPDASELSRQRAWQPEAGCISIAVPLYNTRPAFLRDMTHSLLSQTYSNFYQMYFIKDKNDQWKCINIYTVSDDGAENSLPQIETTETEEKDTE